MPRCRGSSALVLESVRATFPRVLGVGLPHSGTTTLHSLLVMLGCCFATHNHPSGFGSKEAQSLFQLCGSSGTGNSSACVSALLAEASAWQCLTDNPWASHWKLLAASAPPKTRFVLTRFIDPLQYGISRVLGGMPLRRGREWALMTWAPGSKVDTMIREHAWHYASHVRAVRASLGHSKWYAEICWHCGDNASTLIRKLRIPPGAWRADTTAEGSVDLPDTPAHKSSGDEKHRLAQELRERVVHVCADKSSEWLCAQL